MTDSDESGFRDRRLLAIGVIFPAFVLPIEFITRLCASVFFDPLPSWGHVAAVASVPAINFLLWRALRRGEIGSVGLIVAAGAAMAISGSYALLFLPILPIALIGILFFGMGLLAFAPLLALIASVKLMALLIGETGRPLRACLGGIALGLGALILVDLPATATHVAVRWAEGDESSARKAAALMRTIGDEETLLHLCYGDGGRPAGLVSFVVSSWGNGFFGARLRNDTDTARELYFRATGRAFNASPKPVHRADRDWMFDWDGDRGGEAVGQRSAGLRLDQSRIDGSVAAADNVAYIEWTPVFANSSEQQMEARLSLALPAGAVASRATLWVNGEPREASVAGRGEARAAYSEVVRMRRDPLLVTTDGAGRLLVQAFPIMPHDEMKIRIGLTVPLEIARDGSRSFALPAIADRNFDLPADLRHTVWIEGDAPLAWRGPGGPGGRRLRGTFGDPALLGTRPRISAPSIASASSRLATVAAKGEEKSLAVLQTIAPAPRPGAASLHILVDGSAGNEEAAMGLKEALRALPAGLPVSLAISADRPIRIPAARWSPAQRQLAEDAIDSARFRGGQDDGLLLADAMAAGPNAALLWVHGPQPVAFVGSRGRIEQMLERSGGLPRLVRYQAGAGPRFKVNGTAWFETARDAIPTGNPAADLASLLAEMGGGTGWRVTRTEVESVPGASASSVHVARLWGAEQLAVAANSSGKDREKAIALAHRLNIVTPVSGAVVLERDVDYQRAGLKVPDGADVPTVPEPGTWALIAIVAGLLLWVLRRRRPRAFA